MDGRRMITTMTTMGVGPAGSGGGRRRIIPGRITTREVLSMLLLLLLLLLRAPRGTRFRRPKSGGIRGEEAMGWRVVR